MSSCKKTTDVPSHRNQVTASIQSDQNVLNQGAQFGLLGKTLGHSYSPLIHNALGNPNYSLFEKQPEELADFFNTPNLQGLNITIPYKVNALHACQEVSAIAKRIGCVNTMVRRQAGWYGHNTDYDGFIFMLKEANITIKQRKVVILGDGATSHTVHLALEDLGAREIIHLSRRQAPYYSDAYAVGSDAHVLINTTPVGMYPHCPESLVNLDDFPHLTAVVDVVYNPYRTNLLIEAEKRGLIYSDGLPMLVGQAVAAAQLFMETQIADEVASELIKTIRHDQENIILIGMPGVGKTTVGSQLANALNRPLVDCDAIFEEHYGNPSEYIKEHGEADFRAKETELLQTITKRTGLIIATGGGVITRPENYPMLRQNGRMYWLRRPLETLDTTGRILSTGGLERLQSLYEKRHPLYTQFAQVIIDYTTPEDGVKQIYEDFQNHYSK